MRQDSNLSLTQEKEGVGEDDDDDDDEEEEET